MTGGGDQNPTIIQVVGSVNDEAQALAYHQAMDAQMRSQIMMQQQQQPGVNESMDQQALLAAHAQQNLQVAEQIETQNIIMQLRTMLSHVPPDSLANVINDLILQQPNLVPYLEQIFKDQQMHEGQVELIEEE